MADAEVPGLESDDVGSRPRLEYLALNVLVLYETDSSKNPNG